jgi:hypothetical protein
VEVSITEKEITAGVVTYLNSRGFNLDPASVKIEYTIGRKNKGVVARLVETIEGADPKEPVKADPRKTTAPKEAGEVGTATAAQTTSEPEAKPALVQEQLADPAPVEPEPAEAQVDAPIEQAVTAEATGTTSLFS